VDVHDLAAIRRIQLRFFVDCHTANQAGCTQRPDPGNPAWTVKQGVTDTSPISVSSLYVPSDPEFRTVDYGWQGPANQMGTLTHITYSSPGHVTPADKNYLGSSRWDRLRASRPSTPGRAAS
jgi:hypothetical protein